MHAPKCLRPPPTAAQVEDDSLLDADEIPEPGFVDDSGQLRRPWCPATRILDHREAAAEAAAAEEKRRGAQALGGEGLGLGEAPEPPPRTGFPEIEGVPLYQRNEGKGAGEAYNGKEGGREGGHRCGVCCRADAIVHACMCMLQRQLACPASFHSPARPPTSSSSHPAHAHPAGKWDFTLGESADGRALQLDVAFGRYLDTSAIQADVQPTFVRLLARGRLLQLALPVEVRPDAAVAQRSRTTGNLLVTMPLASEAAAGRGGAAAAIGVLRPENAAGAGGRAGGRSGKDGARGGGAQPELLPAVVSAAAGAGASGVDDDDLPPLL